VPVDRQSLEVRWKACRGLWSGQERRTLKRTRSPSKAAPCYIGWRVAPGCVEWSKRRFALIPCTRLALGLGGIADAYRF